MASNQQIQKPGSSTGGAPAAKEFTVRVPRATNKRYSIMKFGSSSNMDFTKCGQAVIGRENNLKEYKQANDIDQQPKFGAGSEYGRDRRDEARKKKYGIQLKKYNVDEQPWLLRTGKGKETKKFKGNREGGILENASYYIFTQCPDGAFEAHPVQEWHNFHPVINYKYLNSEEAEEEFSRRDKTLNYFSIMLKKRLKNDDDVDPDAEGTETKGKSSKKSKKKDFVLTDMDEWAMLSDEEQSEGDESGDEDKEKKPKKKAGPKKSRKRRERRNSDDEAMEESDDMDEGQEVDYMTDTDSEDEDMYNNDVRDKREDKYEEKGVEDEEGLKKILDSDEEEEEEKKKEEEEKEDGEDGEEKKSSKSDDSDSSSDSSSDSDDEKEENITSPLFIPKKEKTGRATPSEKKGEGGKKTKSRTPTPTASQTDTNSQNGKKRKGNERDSPALKKVKTDPDIKDETDSRPGSSVSTTASENSSKNTFVPIQSEGISEDAVRRYLVRKPMTTKDLLQKFKSKKLGLSSEQLVNAIVSILKRINPKKQMIDGKMHLYLKPE